MANTVNLVTTFLPLVDEKFTTESRKSLLTNNDFDWTGAHSIKVYTVSQSVKLFISPDIVIKAGSKIIVTQHGRTTEYSNSGVPAVYPTHQEIMLTLFEGWA